MQQGFYFDELSVGQSAEITRVVGSGDIEAFAALSGDTNPVHLDDAFARATPFGGRIAHGMLAASYVSAVMGTRLPGPGGVYLKQSLSFRRPVKIGDAVTTKDGECKETSHAAFLGDNNTWFLGDRLALEGMAKTVAKPREDLSASVLALKDAAAETEGLPVVRLAGNPKTSKDFFMIHPSGYPPDHVLLRWPRQRSDAAAQMPLARGLPVVVLPPTQAHEPYTLHRLDASNRAPVARTSEHRHPGGGRHSESTAKQAGQRYASLASSCFVMGSSTKIISRRLKPEPVRSTHPGRGSGRPYAAVATAQPDRCAC